MHPMKSNPQMNGLPVLEFIPATKGPTNHGPNRRSYKDDDTRLAKLSGSISLSSLILYRLVFILKFSYTVVTSVANPVSPKKT
ncbi:hypothetical protein OGATHE_005226 [Ogataea polymorpha]|uniref:Uncharacterized protein n=1 Tax=Ogataea polymorpha TaxID=460523 RepID=A0A9P8NWU4_9ASCO|nr:hypothetical protein OGATHE_005226 [Ogataea polymorpha]